MALTKRLQKYIIESQTYSLKNAPFYLKLLAFLYKILGRKALARLFVTSDKCKGCKICQKSCPNMAIVFRLNNPRRNNKCKGCLLCVYNCPNQAIELPLSILIGAFLLIFLPYDEFIKELFSLQFSSKSVFLDTLISLFLWSFCYLVVIFIFGKMSFIFSTIPIVKKIRGTKFVKRIYRRIHPIRIFPIILPEEHYNLKVRDI